jgi:hypothetical protein
VYIGLAIFWLTVGIVMQVFWDTLKDRMWIQVDRTMMAAICLILVSYCILRWRMARALVRTHEVSHLPPPPRPRVVRDPTFDFSDAKDKTEPEA